MGDTASSKHGRFLVAETRAASTLLGPDFAAGAVHVGAPFGGGGTQAGRVGFEDYGAVEEVFSKGEQEVCGWVVGEGDGFEGGEVVEGALDGLEEGVWWRLVGSHDGGRF